MIHSNVLIIGSTGRNTGKTEFACRIINNHSIHHDLIGVKVIPVDKNETKCHRGLDSCGICDSLVGDYQIIEEKDVTTSKDTSRMMRAGAKQVYLLIVDRNLLEKGMNALLKKVPENSLIVIESNSIRNVVEPGLFIVSKKSTDESVKPTCSEVIESADKIIEFHNMNWDFNPNNILIQNRGWLLGE